MNLLRALATISSMTFLSRVLGLARDFFIARVFGAGLATDAFFVAFRIPNLLRRLFAEGAFSQAFVPILGEYRNRQAPEQTRELVDCVASVLFIALVVAAALGVVAAPLIVSVGATFRTPTSRMFASLLRILPSDSVWTNVFMRRRRFLGNRMWYFRTSCMTWS
jgi:putative peptidoglycan lipid II flippase